jgi:NitT/TauT family transport system ATP-binding protein
MPVPFPHPRNRLDPAFRQMVDDIYAVMTRRAPVVHKPALGAAFGTALHPVSTNLLSGLLETLAAAPYDGRADLPPLAASLQLELDDLFPISEALQLLKFAEVEEGDIRLTPAGRDYAHASLDTRKTQFADALRQNVPLIAAIRQVLDERWNHRCAAARFLDELEDHMSPAYADATLKAAITWGRYAELFGYDDEADQFFLDEEEPEEDAAE